MIKRLSLLIICLLALFAVTLQACGDSPIPGEDEVTPVQPSQSDTPTAASWEDVVESPADWDGTKRADISYQLLVYSFADSNGDGWGDIQGIIDKLDYINSLGVKAIWLSPIHPSMSYHGYDVTDYSAVNSKYGTMSDFDKLITAAHAKGIKIYLDYVMNHTGKDHPWFQSAIASADSPYRDFYVFSYNPQSDIAAGKIDMIEKTGYAANQWYTAAVEGGSVTGYLKFTLNWSNASAPTVTITQTDKPDAENPDTSTDGAKYLWFGDDGKAHKFYDKGNNIYELSVDYKSSWGFLIRTSNTTWDGGTKYGASSTSSKISLGKAFTLNNSTAADIVFDDQKTLYYHSHFATDWFADLNYGPASKATESGAYKAMAAAAKEWVKRGVDGLRLDAVKHIYHNATSNENPTFLKSFYDEMNAYYKQQGHTDDFYMVGEVLSEYNEVAPYYAGLPALFEFSFWYRLSYAINNNTGCYFAKDILSYQQTYAGYRANYIEATKLSNHDEERSATTLGKSVDKEKLAAAVLLTSAGSPYIYYGEELGIFGNQNNGDEYVRSPMLWGDNTVTKYTDKIDASVANSIKSVSAQQSDANSLLSTYLKFTKLRNTYPALASGTMTKHTTYNESNSAYSTIGAWYMTKDTQKLLVIHNFGAVAKELPITDTVEKAIATSGTVQQKQDGSSYQLRLGAYSSVVLQIK
jgi:glycosidase